MKNFKSLLIVAVAALSVLSVASCNKDKDNDYSKLYPNALVTLKTNPEGKCYLQIDDKTTALPVNLKSNPYKKEMRVMANIEESDQPSEGFDRSFYVNWIDSVRTKTMSPSKGKDNILEYGNDPIEIINDPLFTIAEDGYLTLRFRTKFDNCTFHIISLVPGDKPNEVVLHHNAQGNHEGYVGDGIIAFRLDLVPEEADGTEGLKLKWESYTGPKEHTFNYIPRKNQ